MESPGAVCDLWLPNDIARLVRRAYSDDVAGSLPASWGEIYATACIKRSEDRFHKQERAATCCIQSVYEMVRDESALVDWYELRTMASPLAGHDEDRGQRAVRDTQETVEVLLFELRDSLIYLLPWVGDESAAFRAEPRCQSDRFPQTTWRALPRSRRSACLFLCAAPNLSTGLSTSWRILAVTMWALGRSLRGLPDAWRCFSSVWRRGFSRQRCLGTVFAIPVSVGLRLRRGKTKGGMRNKDTVTIKTLLRK